MNQIVGSHDIVFLTLDTLRHDVAVAEERAGRTPNFSALFPGGWEKRHSPGNFTYSAHHAFFAGFLPTPAEAGAPAERLFAARFEGSETIGPNTRVFDTDNIIAGLHECGYHSICIGGVGFFNQRTPLSKVLPGYFDEAHWTKDVGVADPASTAHQLELAAYRIHQISSSRRVFLFINISAIHQPNHHYIEGAGEDSKETHAAALRYVDSQLPVLTAALRRRGPAFLIACSDHGTLYGENGWTGHRVGHEDVYTVPFATALLPDSDV